MDDEGVGALRDCVFVHGRVDRTVFVHGRVDRTVFLCRVEWTGLCFCAGSSGQDCGFVQFFFNRTVFAQG